MFNRSTLEKSKVSDSIIIMTIKEKFEELKERDMNAKSDAERAKIDLELKQLADSDPVEFEAAVIASARQTLSDAKELRIKEQLFQRSEMISMTYS